MSHFSNKNNNMYEDQSKISGSCFIWDKLLIYDVIESMKTLKCGTPKSLYPDIYMDTLINKSYEEDTFVILSTDFIYHTTKTVYGSDLASLTDTVASLYTKQKVKHSFSKSIPNKAILLWHEMIVICVWFWLFKETFGNQYLINT